MLPSGLAQLVVILLFVVPGFVHQLVRARLDGPSPEDLNQTFRVLRAIAISAVFGLVYLVMAGGALVEAAQGTGPLIDRPRLAGLLALLGLFGVPAVAAIVTHAYRISDSSGEAVSRLVTRSLSNYDPTPTAWDFAYRRMGRAFVRAMTADGRWIGGYFGDDSFASSFPQPREVFLEQAFKMSHDGSFGEPVDNTAGVYVRCDDVRVIEFLAPVQDPDASDTDDRAGHTALDSEGGSRGEELED